MKTFDQQERLQQVLAFVKELHDEGKGNLANYLSRKIKEGFVSLETLERKIKSLSFV